jgi:cytoskeletal protein CcmA (bactofilin family)
MPLIHRKPQQVKGFEDLDHREMIGVLEPGIEVEGKIKLSSGAFRLNSHFKGEIEGDGVVLVAEQGEVDASIKVKAIRVTGKVKGSIHASDRIEINQHGVVLGDIFTPVLVVEPGGYFDGTCHMPTPGPEDKTTNVDNAPEKSV